MFVGISKFCWESYGGPLDLGLHCKGYTNYPCPPLYFYFILYLFLYILDLFYMPFLHLSNLLIYLFVYLFIRSFCVVPNSRIIV